MRIVLIIQKPQARGAELFASNLGNSLMDKGHQVFLISLFPGEFDLPFAGEQIHLNRNPKHRLWDWNAWKSIHLQIERWNADIVLAMAGDTLKFMVQSKLAFGWKAKAVFYNGSIVSDYIHSSLIKKYNSFLFQKLDAVISVSQASASDLDTLFDFPMKHFVIPVGIEAVIRKRRDELPMQLLHIGGFTFEKNHEGLLRIFAEILKHYPEIRLVSFGSGPLENHIKGKAQELGVFDQIDWRGTVENPFQKIDHQAILLLPSLIEGYPAVIVEAFLNKIPVVAYEVGGVRELLLDGQTGWLVSKDDEKGFTQKVLRILETQQDGLKPILKAAEKFAVKNCLLPDTVRKYEEAFEGIMYPLKDSPLRILQLITRKQRRGAEIFAAQLSENLLRQGHIVKVVSLFEGPDQLPFSGSIACLEGNKSMRFWDWKAWKRLNGFILEFQPDVVQANASESLKYASFSKKFWAWKSPLVFRNANQMSLFLNNPIQKGLNQWWMNSVSGVASVSEICKNDFMELFPKKSASFLPIGIDPLDILEKCKECLPISLPNRFLLFAGSMVPEKNPLALLDIFKELEDKDISLLVLGSGPLRSTLNQRIAEMELRDRIFILESQTNIFPILSRAEALLLPSRIEGLPAIILEAMYCKTPVVAYGVGGIPEILKSGETGWCIPPGDKVAFIHAIQEVLNLAPSDKAKILENAFKMVLENYTLQKVTHQFEEFYQSILHSSR